MLPWLLSSGLSCPQPPSGIFARKRSALAHIPASCTAARHGVQKAHVSLRQASAAELVAAALPTQERRQELSVGVSDAALSGDAGLRGHPRDRSDASRNGSIRDAQRSDTVTASAGAVQPSKGPPEPQLALPCQPNMLLLPVAICKTVTLSPQATIADGTAELLRHLPNTVAAHEGLPSGVLRLEVAVSRTATTALRWLAGQQQNEQGQDVNMPEHPSWQQRSPAAGGPFMYFSGRRSSAPDTPGATAAEAATRGWSALAGAGAAWQWWGPGGEGFDSRVVSALQRFLSPNQPRVRILGGVRFNPRRLPAPEWTPFGSHCFVLPLLELTEAEDCCVLAVTVAWDPSAAEANDSGQKGFCGCGSLQEAKARAEAALRQMRPPTPASAYGFRVSRSEPRHAPSKAEWNAHMAALLGGLQEVQDTGAPAVAALASLLDPGLARQEYLTHGQQGLDDLLAAMTLSATASDAVRQPVDGDVGDGLDALRDLIDGKVTISELTAAAQASATYDAEAAISGAEAPPPPVQAAAGVAGTVGSLAANGAPAAAAVSAEAEEELSKVVMARRTTMRIDGPLDPLHVLMSLQERDPRAYQLYFAPSALDSETALGTSAGSSTNTGAGTASRGPRPAFLACTPERLYARSGRFVASEAVAGTRPRGKGGDVEQDFWLSLDLLCSAKDHAEFSTVRDWIAAQLAGPCEDVTVEIRKSVLKQGSVQHLFGRVSARLRRGRNDAHLLAALHPTPAVCGRPREAALGYLEELETFDRGWYAGPFGWISGVGAEFVVAIRSGLVCPEPPGAGAGCRAGAETYGKAADAATGNGAMPSRDVVQQLPPQLQRGSIALGPYRPASLVHMFAGVGVVRGSDPSAEWQELDLKIRSLSSALMPAPLPAAAPNINVAWASLLVEELCRMGVNMFCVAPGSRSSPLTHAIASHPRARLNVCIDERSLGFWALGYGRAAGRPAAVVTSSGTAVANLLPAVVEASLSGVPLLLLTADRPGELRDTAANQTIDQTKIFGGFVRWFFDLPPPTADVPGRTILTTASTAYRAAVSSAPPGPVHLNLQFREPLAPVAVPWQSGPFMQGLAQWEASQLPYTSHISGAALPGALLSRPLSLLNTNHAAGSGGGTGGAFERYGVGGADVAALQALLAGARRGLVVVGELTDPRDILAARQICSALGWPVVADVLSGLRVGAPRAAPSGSTPAPTLSTLQQPSPPTDGTIPSYDHAVPLVHHMDHLLLGDRSWWRELRPDVILQLGPHLTSKRLGQFMDWAVVDDSSNSSSSCSSSSSSGGAPWVYVAPHTLRHDPSHLVTHRAVLHLTEFRDAVVGPAAAAAAAAAGAVGRDRGAGRAIAASSPWEHVSEYGRMLLQLDEVVSHEIDSALASLDSISEPFIARSLARSLPPGHGLFIGNSMPIRDMDMYACPPAPASAASAPPRAAAAAPAATAAAQAPGLAPIRSGGAVGGVPVAANRGASGIDGVLSTAAGFAEGLGRPATLLVGDLSFLHDINGLNLLRAGELRPPLTVVLINNSGGGIFSFLPIAASVPEDEFTPLWATPQNVDLEAMCRAQGIPHQKVTTSEGLVPALQAAWGLNRHSVVEVITDRSTNVELHRVIQAAALRGAQRAHWLARLSVSVASAVQPAPPVDAAAAAVTLNATDFSWRRYRLPLKQPLTTRAPLSAAAQSNAAAATSVPGAAAGPATGGRSSGRPSGPGWREGLLVRVQLSWPNGQGAGEGVGEVAPLPGLHSESLEEAEMQVAALSGMLARVPVPPSLALLGGRVTSWLQQVVGLGDPQWLAPSVRFGLESALLSALAAALGTTVTDLLASPSPPAPSASVLVNGLLSPPVTSDEAADAAAAAAAAARLAAAGYTAIKVKVARRLDPEADARILAAIRSAVGRHVVLRADANRGWTSLQQALAFGRGLAAAGVCLQYVEEPTTDPRDMAAFYVETGVPVAADESLDEGLLGLSPQPLSNVTLSALGTSAWAGGGGRGADGAAYSAHGLPANRAAGLAAVVVKPGVVGGVEAAAEWARWGRRRGVKVVVSSTFESSIGLAHLVQLAAAVDAYGNGGADDVAVHHGLGTLQWFGADVSTESLSLEPVLLGQRSSSRAKPPGSPPDQTQQQHQPRDGRVSSREDAASGHQVSDGGEFVPLQALCSRVDQAGRILEACASGHGLHLESLAPSPSCTTLSEDGHHARTTSGACASLQSGGADDPWAIPYAHGGILHRSISLEVVVPPPTPTASSPFCTLTAAAAASEPSASRIPGTNNDGGGCLRVRVCGLELLPAGGASSASHTSNACQPPRPFVFLHGFLGRSTDWLPVMRALAAAGHRCIALDLPGHGGTAPVTRANATAATANGPLRDSPGTADTEHPEGHRQWAARPGELPVTVAHSIPGAAACVAAAVGQLGLERAVLVGYSLGARVALQAAVEAGGLAELSDLYGNGASCAPGAGAATGSTIVGGRARSPWSGVVLVSGTAGIKDAAQATARAANDDLLAASLMHDGLADFVQRWYEQPLWSPLRRHPAFGRMLARRAAAAPSQVAATAVGEASEAAAGVAAQMAAALSGMSTGRMVPLWDRLDPWVGPPTILVVGELDAKFLDINTHMLARLVRRHTAAADAGGGSDRKATECVADAATTAPQVLAMSTTDSSGATASDNDGNTQMQQEQRQQGRCSGGLRLLEQVQQLGHALVRIGGVGHAVHVESPESLLRVLREAVFAINSVEALAKLSKENGCSDSAS